MQDSIDACTAGSASETSSGSRLMFVLAAACAALCVVSFLMRLTSAVSLDHPWLGTTSGCEDEAMFTLWRIQHGEPPYIDALAPPYAASYFNWLFYWIYSSWGRLWLWCCGCDEAWLPTIWRGLSLAFGIGSGVVAGAIFRTVAGASQFAAPKWLAVVTVLSVANPLFHWWMFTVRPDIGALFFEALGLLILARSANRPDVRAATLAAVSALLAWGFKQSHVFFFAGGILFLALERRWRDLAVFVAILVLGTTVVFKLSDTWYRQNSFELNVMAATFSLRQGLRLCVSAFVKNPLAAAGVFLTLPMVMNWRQLPAFSRLACLCTWAALPLAIAGSAKTGASDNYFLSPCLFACMVVLGSLTLVSQGMHRRRWLVSGVVTGALATQVLSLGLLLTGLRGRLDIRDDALLPEKVRTRLHDEEGRVFVTVRPLNLPWLHGGRPPVLPSWMYTTYERIFPERFTPRGGLKSLVRDGYFDTIMDVRPAAFGSTFEASAARASFDVQAELPSRYECVEDTPEWRVYRLRKTSD